MAADNTNTVPSQSALALVQEYIAMQKITPFLWFDGQAEDAARFYVSVFKNSRIVAMTRYGDAGPGPIGSVMTVTFEISGVEFVALNAGPQFTFSPATSFVVNCDNQAEVDHYWEKLSAGGKIIECGWLTDKFGVTWQIVPVVLLKLIHDKDPARAQRVMKAMMKMKKLIIKDLEQAAAEK